jgi:Holliday junction resolvase RusA-like endonuclease
MKTEGVFFVIDHVPTPKPVGPRTAKADGGWTRYLAFKRHAGLTANQHFKSPILGAFELSIAFYLPLPPGCGDHDRRAAERGDLVPVGKPDLKNLVAAVEDSLTKIAWPDDSAVVSYNTVFKRYAIGESPRCVVTVRPLPAGLVRERYE